MDEQTHYDVAREHVAQAGAHLRRWLDQEPRNIDNLDEFEMALVRRVCGNSVLDRVMNRAAQLDQIEREAERDTRPAEHIERVRFRMAEHRVIPANEEVIKTREFSR